MACFSPLKGYRVPPSKNGGRAGITFKAVEGIKNVQVPVPCGQCIGCRLERSRQWAMRCVYESQLHEDNCFVTLTYNDDNLPAAGSLSKRDFQLFIKRLRKRFPGADIRYFCGGEYGDQLGRPHFHACLFGIDFPDRRLFRRGRTQDLDLYTSELLDSIWQLGFATVGNLSFESAAYTARYCMKKMTGAASNRWYERVISETGEVVSLQPEFALMSLRPAIGKRWFEKFQSDVYPSDFLIVNGAKVQPPKFFDRLLKRLDEDAFFEIKDERQDLNLPLKRRRKKAGEGSPRRLKVKETVQQAALSLVKRHKEI